MRGDVLVVGAGPAGIATAIAASLRGLRVIVADARRPPIDKPCGEGLLPEAVSGLRHLGIDLSFSPAFPFAGIRFTDENSSAAASIPRGVAFGLRRTTLHQILIDRAVETGVTFHWGARVSDFHSGGARIDGSSNKLDWLVGADGQNSAVGKWAGLSARRASRTRFGFRRHYSIRPWTKLVEVQWSERSQMVVTPIAAEEICVSLFTSDAQLRIDRAFAQFPEVAAQLAGAQPLTTEQGAITSLQSARAVVRGRVALVGDASCTVDGIAGQGMSLAFQQAIHLGEALAAGNLAQYEFAHRRISRMPVRMARLLLLMDRNTWLRRKALRMFAAKPALFSKVISLHTGEPLRETFNAKEIFDLGWRAIWA